MENFYLPLFREFIAQHGKNNGGVRVLDCDCGTGLSLDCLAGAGWQAFGIDTWAARVEQWGPAHRGPGRVSSVRRRHAAAVSRPSIRCCL